jgi:hypothetical protein
VKLQIPPLRYPGFPVDLDGVGGHHAPFLKRKAHTWSCLELRGRKSGFASVGMTKGTVAVSILDRLVNEIFRTVHFARSHSHPLGRPTG